MIKRNKQKSKRKKKSNKTKKEDSYRLPRPEEQMHRTAENIIIM